MSKKQKLELTWIGKGDEPTLEPRILIEDPTKSYGDPNSQNMLIHGDNLLALKALEQEYSGKIKCIYIDPPYNTGNAFEHYDDGVEHSLWLSLIRPRLELLRNLLSDNGVIFVQIDDNEAPYLKVLMDEVFGRSNYEATFYVKVRHEDRILREDIKYQLVMEQVLCYRKSEAYKSLRREKTKEAANDYLYDVKITGKPLTTKIIAGYDVEIYDRTCYEIIKTQPGVGSLKLYQIRGSLITQSGSASEYYELNLRSRRAEDGLGALYKVIGMGVRGDGLGYRYIMQPDKPDSKNGFYFQGKPLTQKTNVGLPYANFKDFVDEFNRVGYEGGVEFKNGKKPESYVEHFIRLSGANPKDIILDSFLGSGTTAAVAQKLGLRWIGIELGEHAYTHCIPRLQQVTDGTDRGGISNEIDWNGGSGFKFYELAPSLLKQDSYGNWIITKEYNADLLAHAMAKQEGFTYSPDQTTYWKQGYSTELDYIYTTTQHITIELIDAIHNGMQANESLLIACRAFDDTCKDRYDKITIKKIPQILLGRCEFGKNDYNLNVLEPIEPEDTYGDTEE